MPGRSRTRRLRVFRSVTLGVSLLLLLGLLELGARVRERLDAARPRELHYEFSPTLHHRLKPNARYQHVGYEFDYLWVNNSLGMRDRERSLHKPAGVFRIFFLGDSMIQGHGVPLEETSAVLLEASLNRPARSRVVEVMNGGVFGYSPFLEYLYLREIIDSIEPDLVVLGLSLVNDVGEDHFYARKARRGPSGETVRFEDEEWPWSRIVQELDARSQRAAGTEADAASPGAGSATASARPGWKQLLLRSALVRVLKGRRDRQLWFREYRERRHSEFELARERLDDIVFNLGLVNYPTRDREARLGHWERTLGYLEKIADLCAARGAPLVLLVIPPLERLNGRTDFDEPYEILAGFGRERSVPVVDLLPAFLEDEPTALYYELDRHWTARGHRVAAGVLERRLRQLGLLPDPLES